MKSMDPLVTRFSGNPTSLKITDYSLLYTIALLLLTTFFMLIVAYHHPPFLNDDSYITLTYTKNLVNGNGFVFNHPPVVLGTTTPLFTLVVAGLALVFTGVDIPVIAVLFTALCWSGIAWTFFFFRKEWGLVNWEVCILALILTASVWIEFLGMEFYLFTFLLILAISLFLREYYGPAGFTAGLLFLTRGEGVLVLVVLAITFLIQHWATKKTIDKELIQNLLMFGFGITLPIFLWVIYAHFTFGHIFPNTLAAKQAQVQSGIWHTFLQKLIGAWIPLWGKSFTIAALPSVNFWQLIVLLGFTDVLLRKRNWLILTGWIILYILGYSFLNVAGYLWYQLPILFVMNLFFGLGIIRIVEIFLNHIKPYSLSISISLVFTLSLIFVMAKPVVSTTLTYQGDFRGESYVALSDWFRNHTNSSESIAYIEIGYLGYYTDNKIIDLAGLILPDVIPHIAKGDFEWSFWQYEPDYYVYLPDFDWVLANIRKDPRFAQQYQLVTTLPGPENTDFIIYKRMHDEHPTAR